MENPQALDGEGTPGISNSQMWPGWEQEVNELSVHAANANSAAFHADVAAKHAASLAQWVQYLSGTLAHLQNKVTELEDWKKKALEETRKLREEHKILRQRVLKDEATVSPKRQEQIRDDELTVPGTSSGLTVIDKDAISPGNSASGSPGVSRVLSSGSSLAVSVPSSSSLGDVDSVKEEGVQVSSIFADGAACDRAAWRIGHLSTKLRGCMGRALVSSPFSAGGLDDIRLMISPDGKEPAQGKNRRQKELYTKKITEGPLDACLKLKIPNCPAACELEYYLVVGSVRRGPFKHNFAESTVSECDDFGDWLKHVDTDRSLTVSVEILFAPALLAAGASGKVCDTTNEEPPKSTIKVQ